PDHLARPAQSEISHDAPRSNSAADRQPQTLAPRAAETAVPEAASTAAAAEAASAESTPA
ncbi:MAG: hypothetical protein ACTJF6_11380, partial [Microbacteriaceae bacterium]